MGKIAFIVKFATDYSHKIKKIFRYSAIKFLRQIKVRSHSDFPINLCMCVRRGEGRGFDYRMMQARRLKCFGNLIVSGKFEKKVLHFRKGPLQVRDPSALHPSSPIPHPPPPHYGWSFSFIKLTPKKLFIFTGVIKKIKRAFNIFFLLSCWINFIPLKFNIFSFLVVE